MESDARFLGRVFSRPLSCAVVLECLSHVEYTGAQWILAVPATQWGDGLHGQVTDEIDHGKRMGAEARAARRLLSRDDLFVELGRSERAVAATEAYLNQLIRTIFKKVIRSDAERRRAIACHTVVSFLLERRLLKIYPHMAAHGATESSRATAKKLILEEKEHLALVRPELAGTVALLGSDLDELLGLEQGFAEAWFDRLEEILRLELTSEEEYGKDGALVSGPGRSVPGLKNEAMVDQRIRDTGAG
jgi:hypothetical protein